MKSLKEYLKMILTAVICFAVNVVSGKKGQAEVIRTILTGGQAVSGNKDGHGTVLPDRNFLQHKNPKKEKLSFFGCKNLCNRSVLLKMYGDGTDFPVGPNTHIRAPDPNTGSNNIMQAAFLKIAA